MPLPFILTGLGVAAGVMGAVGHSCAKETNEKAQRISDDAQELYNTSKALLEAAQQRTEKTLFDLGSSKKRVLDSSMRQFLITYDKIKEVNVSESVGLNEISNFMIERHDAIQMKELSDIYESSIPSGAAGAAAGAVIALAANGALPIVTGGLGLAGSALAAGEIGAAAGIAGSALSFGAAMTPLAAVAAPVVFFTALSASLEADENLEKAQAMYAEAEAAAEKMKVSQTLCSAISDRSEMFQKVLIELDGMFSECVGLLEGVVRKKQGRFFKRRLKSKDFTEEELALVAVTRSLAGAVKSIIDTPILTEEGSISEKFQKVYNQTEDKLPDFSMAVEQVRAVDYRVTPVAISSKNVTSNTLNGTLKNEYHPVLLVKIVMWIFTVYVTFFGISFLFTGEILAGIVWIIAGLIMGPKTNQTMRFLPRFVWMLSLMIIGCIFL